MFIGTVQQAKRFFKILAGFTLLAVGAVMLVTPGPGWLAIALGLTILAAEYVWARRLLNRLKAQGERLRHAVLHSSSTIPPREEANESAEPVPEVHKSA